MFNFSGWTQLMTLAFVAIGALVCVVMVFKGLKGNVGLAGRMAAVVGLAALTFAFVVNGVWENFGDAGTAQLVGNGSGR